MDLHIAQGFHYKLHCAARNNAGEDRARVWRSSILILAIVLALKNIFRPARDHARGISVDTFREITFRRTRKASGARDFVWRGQIFSLMKFMMPRKFIKTKPAAAFRRRDYGVKYFAAVSRREALLQICRIHFIYYIPYALHYNGQ